MQYLIDWKSRRRKFNQPAAVAFRFSTILMTRVSDWIPWATCQKYSRFSLCMPHVASVFVNISFYLLIWSVIFHEGQLGQMLGMIWPWRVTWLIGVICGSNCLPYMFCALMSHSSFRRLVTMELRVNRNAWENHGCFWTHMANTSETRNTVLFSFMLKWAFVIIICKTPIFILFKIFSVCERSCLCALRTSGTQMMAFGSKTFGWKHVCIGGFCVKTCEYVLHQYWNSSFPHFWMSMPNERHLRLKRLKA